MNEPKAIETELEILPQRKSSSSNNYSRKDPTHGQGGFFYRERPKKDGTMSYYWYFVCYINQKRQSKEYLGTSTSPNILPVGKPNKPSRVTAYHRQLFAQIQAARAYKPKKKHSTQ